MIGHAGAVIGAALLLANVSFTQVDTAGARFPADSADAEVVTAIADAARAFADAVRNGHGGQAHQALRQIGALTAGMGGARRARVFDALRIIHPDSTLTGAAADRAAQERDDVIRTFESERALKDLEISDARDELKRRELQRISDRQQIELLANEKVIATLSLQKTAADLDRVIAVNDENRKTVAMLRRQRDLQASVLRGEQALRNTLVAALFLVLVIAVLIVRTVQHKRRSVALRAESAEYKARAAEAHSLALLAETAQRERAIQQAFTSQLIASQEHERKRIAAELHDSLGQDLIVIKNNAQLAMQHVPEQTPARGQLEDIVSLATTTISDVRQLSRVLRPHQLERIGLTETLVTTLRSVAASSPTAFTVDIDPVDDLLTGDDRIHVFRIIQEAVNNILRHSHAEHAWVRVARDGERIRITVRDDGSGFDQTPRPEARSDPSDDPGFGLQGIRERVQMLGATISVASAPGRGTALTITIPGHRQDDRPGGDFFFQEIVDVRV